MVAECIYVGRRLVVRRTRLAGPQATLLPQWRHFAFLIDLMNRGWSSTPFIAATPSSSCASTDGKEGAGMEHCPSADFSANAAWMCCTVLVHNLVRWSAHLGDLVEGDTLVDAATRTRYFSVPARLVNHLGRPTLRGPAHWPWATSFAGALANLRGVNFAPPENYPRTDVAAYDHLRADNRDELHELLVSRVPVSECTIVWKFIICAVTESLVL